MMAMVIGTISGSFIIACGSFAGILGFFISQGLAEIPASPANKGILMTGGKLENKLLPPGWYFLPLRSKLSFEIVLVPGIEVALRFPVEIRTPDSHDINIPFFIYFIVDPRNPKAFIDAGDMDEVKKKIQDQIEEILREWITSPNKGPQTWREARKATEETANIILEMMFHANFPRISEEFPTEILFKYFDERLTKDDEKKWGERLNNLNETERERLKIVLVKRIQDIEEIKTGRQSLSLCLDMLGVRVTRIGLSNIEPIGATADGVNKVALAQLNADAAKIDAGNFQEEVGDLKEILGDAKEARKAASVRRGITKEEIKESQFSLSPDMTKVAEGVALELIRTFAKKGER